MGRVVGYVKPIREKKAPQTETGQEVKDDGKPKGGSED